jgi:hypothetical protein
MLCGRQRLEPRGHVGLGELEVFLSTNAGTFAEEDTLHHGSDDRLGLLSQACPARQSAP